MKTLRIVLITLVVWSAAVASGYAQTPAPAKAGPAAQQPAAQTPAVTGRAAAPAKAPAVQNAAVKKPAASATPKAPRRLEDVNIEGEIPVPQVLFITARDQRRQLDYAHRGLRRGSLSLSGSTVLPKRFVQTGDPAPAASAPAPPAVPAPAPAPGSAPR